MTRTGRLTLTLAALLTVAPVLSAADGDLTRVSVTNAGAEAPAGASRVAVSADGRMVAFLSTSQLTDAATGGLLQLYVRDRVAGTTILASANTQGQPANAAVAEGDAFNPFIDISGDGRYVVFGTAANNLTSADGNVAQVDVFRKDLVTGAVELVSVGAQGQANQSVLGDPSVSYDGSRVAFGTGTATNLFPGTDNNNANDIVVRDIRAGTTTLASRSTAGVLANNFTERAAISADGRVVAFEAILLTDNLFPNDANNASDIVVHNLDTGVTVPATVATDGSLPGGANFPDISGDGRYVVFGTAAALDPANDGNAVGDVYRRDLVSGTTTLVSARTTLDTASAAGDSSRPAVSADGSRVAFRSAATDLTAADGNAATEDIYTRLLPVKATVRASARADGGQENAASDTPAVSGNGGFTAFLNPGVLLAGDANNADDVYLKESVATDVTPPALAVTATASPTAGQVRVTGTTLDVSGIGLVTVNGTPVRPAAGGAFSADIPAAADITTAAVVSVDGAGNRVEQTATHTPPAANPGPDGGTATTPSTPSTPTTTDPGPTVVQPESIPAPRITRLAARKVKGRVVVTFRLSRAASVRVRVQRSVRRAGTLRFVNVGTARRTTLRAGNRTIRVALPTRPGAYRVLVTATSAGGTAVARVAFRVPGR